MPNVSQVIGVKNSSTHAALAGAQVFVNGIGKGTTDSTGQLILSLAPGTYNIAVKLSGYVTFTTNGVVIPQSNLIIGLEPSASSTTTTFHLSINPDTSADGITITFDNGGTPVITNYSKGGIDVSGLTIGTQVVTGQADGFQAFSQSFNLATTKTGVITMIVLDDQGGALSKRTRATQDPDTSTLLPPTTPEQVPEYIAPNTGQGTYFTMTQARMYIGDLFIDELNGLQFALQDNKIPIYGYASRFWDAKAQGKSLVQGQFAINFISEGYLVMALQNYKTKIDQGDLPQDPIVAEQQNRLLSLVNQLQNPDPAWTPNQFTAAKNEVNALAASLGPDALNAAAASIRVDRQKQLNSLLGLPGDDYSNAVYSDVEFDIVIQYTGAGRTITRRLEKCTLISNESIMSHSGDAILDSYGFIARRLR